MNDGSRIAAGVLNDSDASQSTGISASAMTTKFAVVQPTFCRAVVLTAAISVSPLIDVGAGGCGAEQPDEHEGDDRHADEDQDRNRRSDPQVERVEQVVVPEHRHRARVVSAVGL